MSESFIVILYLIITTYKVIIIVLVRKDNLVTISASSLEISLYTIKNKIV